MTVTLIGSRALAYHFPDARAPRGDWDYQSDKPVALRGATPDGKRCDLFVDSRLAQWPWRTVATQDELYTLKVSHGFWEINGPDSWNKHAADIVFLSRKGARFLRPLYSILLPIWKERYRPHPTNLNQASGKFFADAVHRKYDHDSLHESVAYGDRPLFESVLRAGSDVMVDNSKFWAMDHDTQIMLVREEVYATALERKIIPADYRASPGAAYRWALRRTATSLFKGEWALFLLLHLDELSKPDCDYVRRHLGNQHKLRPAGGKDE
jgi:hypothetical protein